MRNLLLMAATLFFALSLSACSSGDHGHDHDDSHGHDTPNHHDSIN
jgi:hypothetical protein